jgi:hypothetical protein
MSYVGAVHADFWWFHLFWRQTSQVSMGLGPPWQCGSSKTGSFPISFIGQTSWACPQAML